MCALWPWPRRYGLGSRSWHILGHWQQLCIKLFRSNEQWGVMTRTPNLGLCIPWPWPWRYYLGSNPTKLIPAKMQYDFTFYWYRLHWSGTSIKKQTSNSILWQSCFRITMMHSKCRFRNSVGMGLQGQRLLDYTLLSNVWSNFCRTPTVFAICLFHDGRNIASLCECNMTFF